MDGRKEGVSLGLGQLQEARDEAAAVAYRDLVNLRGMMESALHPRVVESALGIQGATPSEPLALSKALRTAVVRLREGQAELPEIRIAVSEPLPDEGDLPGTDDLPRSEEPPLPGEEDDLPTPANEPGEDAEVA